MGNTSGFSAGEIKPVPRLLCEEAASQIGSVETASYTKMVLFRREHPALHGYYQEATPTETT